MPRLLPDATGEWVPPGRIRRELVADFLDGAQPGTANTRGFWTTLASGTFTAANLTTGAQNTIITAATAGSTAELQGRPCELRFMRGVLWTVEGFAVDNIASIDITLSIEGTNVGAQFLHTSGSTDPTLRKLKTGGNIDVVLPWAKMRSTTNKKNLSMLLLGRQYGEIYLFQDDQCIGFQDTDPTWGNATGNVTPKLKITTQTTATRTVQFAQVKQTIWAD